MSNKVKVTRDQADAFENFKKYFKENEVTPMTKRELINVINFGYEVEPEFKVGNWVYDMQHGKVARIDHRGVDDDRVWVDDEELNFFFIEDVRHATPSEIAEEKERRWWSKRGRNVWEIGKGDLLMNTNNNLIYEIVEISPSGNGVMFENDNRFRDMEVIIQNYKVACFAEHRLDVNLNE